MWAVDVGRRWRWPWQTREDDLIRIIDRELALNRSLTHEHAVKIEKVKRDIAEQEEGSHGG